MRVERPLLLLLAALTTGCADPEPFVDYGYSVSSLAPYVSKPRDSVMEYGYLIACYSDKTPWEEVVALATERCGAHGLQVHSYLVTRWQCRATSPHKVQAYCYDPEMVTSAGAPINPFDEKAVQAWEAQTGKKAKPHNNLNAAGTATPPPQPPAAPSSAGAPPAAPIAAPAPAPVAATAPPPAPVAPLTPADIATRPAMQPLPPRPNVQAPPPAAAYPSDGFTLPQGSWGDHFQE
ncbi:MAG: hypothetical protein ACM3Q1_16850 [Bacteroidales bacterium]